MKYDISGKYQNRMDWIFTKEQARYVETELIGEPPVCAVLLADFFLDGRYFLPMFFKRGASPGELYLNMANPYRLIAVSRYVQTKGVEGLSEKDTSFWENEGSIFYLLYCWWNSTTASIPFLKISSEKFSFGE